MKQPTLHTSSAKGSVYLPLLRSALVGFVLLGITSCQSPVVSSTAPSTDNPEPSNPEPSNVAIGDSPTDSAPAASVPSQTTSPPPDQVSQVTTNQSIFEGGGFTVTITGSGAGASYRGCNANQECLDIPDAAQYSQGTYIWENGDYRYVMSPVSRTNESGGAYSLNVYGPDNSSLVDVVVNPVGGDVVLEPNILDDFYTQAETLGACPDYFDIEASRNSSATYPVNGDDAIVEVLCFLAAYQGAYEYWFYQTTPTGAEFVPLSFDTYTPSESGQQSRIQTRQFGGYPTYDPSQETLTVFSKYRGLGDCGSYSEYQWQGTEFELLTYRSKEECDGTAFDPIDYPQIYP